MKGKYSQNGESFHGSAASSSGKKTAVIIIITAVVAAAVTAGIFLLVGLLGNSGTGTGSQTTTAAQTAAVEESAFENSDADSADSESTVQQSADEEQSDAQSTTEQGQTSEDSSSNDAEIVVPTLSGEDQGEKFSATLTPYLAEDTGSGQELTIREVFGSSYSGGGLTFNEDGTFVDGFTASSANSGAYIVEGDTIVATYSNDKNMIASVLEWDGTTPAEIKITFGEIDVYFK